MESLFCRLGSATRSRIGKAALVAALAGALLAGQAGPAAAAPATSVAGSAVVRTSQQSAADVAPQGWRLYSVLSSPTACWYAGAVGVWSGLWYDFECIGIGITPIGPGLYYLWVN